VNKPAGMVVHPDSAHKSGTLIQEILKTHPEIKNVGDEPEVRPGIVHRLDKDTSGIIIIAKNQPTFEYLKNQFQNYKIKKTYLALVVGKLKDKEGVIDLPIGRSKTPLRRLASEKARGKLREAITEYKVLETFPETRFQNSPKPGFGFTLIEAYPKTGRTHQIRAHFKAIGHPIACDKLYSKKPACPFGLSRQFLHAYAIELTMPDGPPRLDLASQRVEAGSRSRFEADLPDDLEHVLIELRNI